MEASTALLLLEPFLPVAIVRLALVGIGEDLERVADVEELLLGGLLRVLVGVWREG